MDNLTTETSTKSYQWDVAAILDVQVVNLDRTYITRYENGNPVSVINTSNHASMNFGSVQLNLYFKDSLDLDNIILALQEIKTEYFSTVVDPKMDESAVADEKKEDLTDNVDNDMYLDFDNV